jgi:hypothetical protein
MTPTPPPGNVDSYGGASPQEMPGANSRVHRDLSVPWGSTWHGFFAWFPLELPSIEWRTSCEDGQA